MTINVSYLLYAIRAQAAVYEKEILRDNGRWSIYNQGRYDALTQLENDILDKTNENATP